MITPKHIHQLIPKNKISSNDIDEIEKIINYVFPQSYRDYILRYGDGLEGILKIGNYISFLTLGEMQKINLDKALFEGHPSNVIFASNGGGEWLCFDKNSEEVNEIPMGGDDNDAISRGNFNHFIYLWENEDVYSSEYF